MQTCLAVGYQDEHKERITSENDPEKIATRFLNAVAELGGTLERNKPVFTLSSLLENPHGYSFSGMSGGPVYAIEGSEIRDEVLFPIGIIF